MAGGSTQTTAMIHPTAIVDARARIDPSAEIGAYAVIDGDVVVGPSCWIGPHVHLTGHTTLGEGNRVHAGSVLGDAPQDLKYKGDPTRLVIGDHNVFREHVTVHRSNTLEEDTTIGSHNLLMASAHVGHNSWIGDRATLANGAMLAGHVIVEDRAFISGNCMLHQFVRVGTLAMMQGGSGVSKDLPPFTIARGINGICGLNVVGMRRGGVPAEERLELRRLYAFLFRSGEPLRSAIVDARELFRGASAQRFIAFIAASKRGVCADTGSRRRPPSDGNEQDGDE